MLKSSPILTNSEVLPNPAIKIINMMKKHEIPMKIGDIPVNGNDLMELFPISGTEVGDIINFMYKEALMNKFNWKDKNATIKYLKTI
jgi:hypothetical protein